MSVNSRLETISIIGQRKALYRQRIPDSSCLRKKTFEIDILVTSWNVDRKTMQSVRIMDRPLLRIRNWNQLSQSRWTSTQVIPIKRLKLAIFWWVQERQQVNNQKTSISIFVACLTAFQICFRTWQLPRLLLRVACIFPNVCQQIIAGANFF